MSDKGRISREDLEHIYKYTYSLWGNVANKTFFITGGTGFFGKWLLESFLIINQRLLLNNTIIVLSRDPAEFLTTHNQFNNSGFIFIKGDVNTFDFPKNNIDYVIHAATEASMELNLHNPLLMYDTIVNGTRRILELCRQKNVISVLHTSSGAVYGEQPYNVTNISEEYKGAPNVFSAASAYAEGKRDAEMLASLYYGQFNVPSKLARCFAFCGPYLPLNAHYAIGNFLLNIINGEEIIIQGDGTPLRSYLYAADLVIWLFTILLKGKSNYPYNVGSDEDISIGNLANLIAGMAAGKPNVKILGDKIPGSVVSRYVPSIHRAKTELELKVLVTLPQAIKKTLAFNGYNVNY